MTTQSVESTEVTTENNSNLAVNPRWAKFLGRLNWLVFGLAGLFLAALAVQILRGKLWLVGAGGVWALLVALLLALALRYSLARPRIFGFWRAKVGVVTPYGLALGALTLFGLWIRVWGQKNGLPYVIPADENLIVDVGTRLLKTGDFDTQMYYYPSLYLYSESLVSFLHFIWGSFSGLYQSINDLPDKTFAINTAPQLTIWQRTFTALVGTAAIPIAYFTVKKLWQDRRAALLAAGFIACSYLATEHSHYVAVDMPMATLALLALYPAWKIVEQGRTRDYVLAAVVAGLSLAVKWNGVTAIILPVVAHVLRVIKTTPENVPGLIWFSRKFFRPPLLWIILSFGLTFLATTPYLLARIKGYSDAFGTNSVKYRLSQSEYSTDYPWLGNMEVIWNDNFWLFLLGLGGVGLLALRGKLADWLALSFPAIYFISINNYRLIYPRNVLPLTLFWAVFAGLFAVWLFDFLYKQVDSRLNLATAQGKRLKQLAGWGLPLLLLVATMFNTVDRTFYANNFNDQPFSYARVENWLKEQAGPGALKLVEMRQQQWGAYPNLIARFPDGGANDFDLEYYRQRGIQYLAINVDRAAGIGYKGSYPELLRPELTAQQFETKTLLKPGPPFSVVRTGVTAETLRLEHPLKADFGDKLRLLGFNAGRLSENSAIYLPPAGPIKTEATLPVYKPGETIGLTLYWQVLNKLPQDYVVFIHLRPQNQPEVNATNRDTPPLQGLYPTSQWKPGEIVTDNPNLFLPESLLPGEYNLMLGWYLNDGKFTPLPVAGGANSITLGKVTLKK